MILYNVLFLFLDDVLYPVWLSKEAVSVLKGVSIIQKLHFLVKRNTTHVGKNHIKMHLLFEVPLLKVYVGFVKRSGRISEWHTKYCK